MITGGGGAVAIALAAPFAPIDFNNTSQDPAAHYATAFNNRPRSFSDSFSRLLLITPFIFTSASTSKCSDSTSKCFPPGPCSVSIFETCSIYIRKTTNGAALGALVALATPLQRIPIISAVATNPILAIGVVANFHQSLATLVSSRPTR